MEVIKNEVINELSLKPIGGSGFYTASGLACPSCGKSGKFGVKFIEKGGVTNCFKCGVSNSIFKYLRNIDKQHLIYNERQSEYSDDKIEFKNIFENTNSFHKIKRKISEVELPKGYKCIENYDYFTLRGISKDVCIENKIYYTNHFLERHLHGYFIIPIFNNGIRVGWVGRTDKSKEWHDKHPQKLRYINSKNTDFRNILGGYDSIKENTEVIVVEGLTDLLRVQTILKKSGLDALYSVVCSFGHSISENQVKMLAEKAEYIILMYDNDTDRKSILKSAYLLFRFIENVYIASVDDDAGSLTALEFVNSITNVVTIDKY